MVVKKRAKAAPKARRPGKSDSPGFGQRALVIVESPTKARTIREFLPAGYTVAASMGHIRDLPGEAWASSSRRTSAGLSPTTQSARRSRQPRAPRRCGTRITRLAS